MAIPPTAKKISKTLLLMTLWIGAVIVGNWAIMSYELTPGPSQAAPTNWPAETALKRDANRPTLVMFVHPHCPCSRASVAELSRLTSAAAGELRVLIVCARAAGASDEWDSTALLTAASRIPGATLVIDQDGAEATRFGTATSGEVVLYAASGSLLFHGGLTAARGHEGNSSGKEAILALVAERRPEIDESPVFGCPLCRAAKLSEEPDSCRP